MQLGVRLFTVLCAGVLWVASLPGAQHDKFDALVAEEFAKDSIGGATVGVIKGGSLVWSKGYGFADVEARTPATADSVYRIGSITKSFTAVMLLQLVERGSVRLIDPVEKYLPEINRITDRPEGAQPVTLLQLATMTSGIGREPADMNKFLVGPVERWEQVMIEALARTTYDHAPGTRYLYSNIGYAALGGALGRAAKRPFVDYVRQSVLKPLAMVHTDFVPSPAIRAALAKGYELRNGKPDGEQPAREHEGRGYKVPNGALYTTVGDLAKFVSLWLGEGPESVLKRATVTDVLSRVASANGNLSTGYGVGFMVQRRGANVFYGHGGSVAGYRAQMLYHPQSKTGVIVLSNVGGGSFNPASVAEKLLTILVDDAR
jgi:CubicO group peptidase (beta-lactamase class C family)